MHANYRRQVPRKETQVQLLGLADILKEEGVSRENMVSEISKIAPFTEQYIRQLLPAKYKMTEKGPPHAKLVSHPKTVKEAEAPAPTERKPKYYLCPVCATKLELRGNILFAARGK